MAVPTTNYTQIRTNLNLNFNNAYSASNAGNLQTLSISRGLRIVDAVQVTVVSGAGNNAIARLRSGVSTSLFVLDATQPAGALVRATAIATPASAELASGDSVTFTGVDANQRSIAIVDVIPYSIP